MAANRNGDDAIVVPTRWQVAVHEAAHAVYAHRQGIAVSHVTIEGIVAVENGDEFGGSFGRCYYNLDGELSLAERLVCVRSLVGPLAADREEGLEGAFLPYQEFVRVAEGYSSESDTGRVLAALNRSQDPEGLYEAACKEAEAFVRDHWTEIVALAEGLMEAVTLSGSGVSAVLGPGWLGFREMLDEMALEDDLAPWMKAAMKAAGTEDPNDIEIGPDGGLVSEG